MRNVVLALVLLTATATPLVAQAPRPAPDFLFGRPHYSLALRSSLLLSRAGSDVFDFVTDQLTLERGDFRAPAFGMEVGVALTPRFDLAGGVEYGKSSTGSEYRRFVDDDRLPIEQRTSLRQTTLTASLRMSLLPRGREVSRLAWVPRTVTPYAGVGGGMVWYEFRQSGDFVDFVDLSVFPADLTSRGWAPSAHVLGGVDVKVWRRLYVTMEGRYVWAHADLGEDFTGFDPIDLAGVRATAGINIVF